MQSESKVWQNPTFKVGGKVYSVPDDQKLSDQINENLENLSRRIANGVK